MTTLTPETRARRVAGLLTGARAELAARGWHRGDYVDETTGAVDLSGALRLAAGSHPYELPDNPAALQALCDAEDELAFELGGNPTLMDAGEYLAAWNDHPTRTRSQVLALLKQTHTAIAVWGTAEGEINA
ncbi:MULTISPECIES: DUF6197 family protein [Protofrankia]|uniref:Uncharacterized protein n=1 Tax=Candidatus Protofrankia datiscae TaxID=2716812 RepID=F8B2L4_9ACTN|nr:MULTISPECIES: hypothetical protein [Protofrankia]AEH08768.1 hypothetical protein FsymDg_1283 [Candidatus Protofrankia datiscae]